MNTNKIKNLARNATKSKDGRTVLSNFGYLTLLQFASYLFPIITVPYLSRVIGVEGYGKIAFASAVMVWVQTVADWGFLLTATRDVAKCRDNKAEVSRIFSETFFANPLHWQSSPFSSVPDTAGISPNKFYGLHRHRYGYIGKGTIPESHPSHPEERHRHCHFQNNI